MSNTYQSNNFSFLASEFEELYRLASQAEQYVYSDPQASVAKQRLFIERILQTLFIRQGIGVTYDKLVDLIASSELDAFISESVRKKLTSIRIVGNDAVHQNKANVHDSKANLKLMHDIAASLFPTLMPITDETVSRVTFIQQLLDRYQPPVEVDSSAVVIDETAHKAIMQEIAEQKQALERELEAKKAESQTQREYIDELTRQQNAKQSRQVLDTLVFNESETRQYLIDTGLLKAGWDIDLITNNNTEAVSREYLTQYLNEGGTKQVFCDYVLWNDDGTPLAVIEAKKTSKSVQIGQQQAKIYADALQKEFGVRPIIFYSNGFETYIWNDAKNEVPRKLYGFYSKVSLQRIMQQRDNKKPLTKTLIDTDISGRSYQIEAIQ